MRPHQQRHVVEVVPVLVVIAVWMALAGVGVGSLAWTLLESVDVVARGSLFYR